MNSDVEVLQEKIPGVRSELGMTRGNSEQVNLRSRSGLGVDIVIVMILFAVTGFLTFQGAQAIESNIYQCSHDYESTWFGADVSIAFSKLSSGSSTQWNDNAHPLYSLIGLPPVYLLTKGIGLDKVSAVRVVLGGVAALWISLLFVLFRLMSCRRFDAILFSVLGGISASAIFWFTVPETFSFGSVSILMALTLVAWSDVRNVSQLWYVAVSSLTLGFTVTNWMAGVIATFVKHSWKQTLQISIYAFCLVLVLWDLKRLVFPHWPKKMFFFLVEQERMDHNFVLQGLSGLMDVYKSFFYHTIVMPDIGVQDKTQQVADWAIMVTQFASPGSGSAWGLVSAGIWTVLLGLGVWALFTMKGQNNVRLALGLMLLGQLVLHSIVTPEIFVFSIHFAPLLVVLAALSTLTRVRMLTVVLTGILCVTAGINNVSQFMKATQAVQCIQ